MDVLVNIDVDDLSKAIAFYQGALGLRVGRRFGEHGVEMLGLNAAIYLLRKDAGSTAAQTTADRRSYRRHWTPVHLDFVVSDLEAAIARALAAGASSDHPSTTYRWGRIAQMADPFGHGFCLIEFLNSGYDEIAD